jgi:glycosyltransferase involved in cell wall biosynthesis
MSELPRISIVVPTRNRPADVISCVRTILATAGYLELVVVDQSDGMETRDALAAVGDPRLRCVPSRLRGATNGRNVGIEATTGDVIAFTDDDCRVAPDWVEKLAGIFRSDPEAAVVCGRVRVPEEVRQRGFAIGFEPRIREWSGRFPPPDRDWGITANLAARREVLARVGPFDPVLGPGAPLLCGEEPDLLFRVLSAGLKVVNASEVQVDHLGARVLGPESRDLWRSYGTGTAAALFKHIRLGDARAGILYLRHLTLLSWLILANLATGKRPTGIDYTLAFLSGALASFRFRIDRRRRLYVPNMATVIDRHDRG